MRIIAYLGLLLLAYQYLAANTYPGLDLVIRAMSGE